MSGEGVTGLPDAAPHRAALSARTDHAVPDNANMRNAVSVVERVNAYGLNANVVPLQAADPLDVFIRRISGGLIDGRAGLWHLSRSF